MYFFIIDSDVSPVMYELMYADNHMIQRAASELLCNLIFEQSVYEECAASQGKQTIIIALCDAEDFETRRAAGGILAALCTCTDVVMGMNDRGIQVVLGLIADGQVELIHRGLECCKYLCANKDVGKKVVSMNGIDIIKKIVTERREREVIECALECMLSLKQNSLM